jgi:dienelactone hydrolase
MSLRWRFLLPMLVTILALAAIAGAVARLEGASRGLVVTRQQVGTAPVTVFRPAPAPAPATAASPLPVVLIAHGFAGSQQLMQPFAVTLARNGFIAVTFDFPGHGRNSAAMLGGLADQDLSQRTLLTAMDEMGRFAQMLAGTAGGSARYAVIGHSMASDIVVRHAQAQRQVLASVGVSLFAPSITTNTEADSPRNLLVIDGALEPGMMAAEALRVVARVAGPDAVAERTYGRFEEGTARRATLSPGVEHIGVLYSAHTQAETLAWLNAAFNRPQPEHPFVDARGRWLGLLLAGVVALAWPLMRLLPWLGAGAGAASRRDPTRPGPTRLRWWRVRGQAPLVLLPALATPLLLWKLPSDFLPILLGDYLVLHFGLYGLLTLAAMEWAGRRPWRDVRPAGGRAVALTLAMVSTCAYALLAVGVPIDRYVFNLHPQAERWPIELALWAGTLPYFLADEWLTRDPAAAPAAYLCSKLAFLSSLVLAIVLNPERLFFLAIIVPAILLLFVVYGLFSRWVNRRTGQPAVAAVANALAFGAFIAITFPRVM